MCSSDLEPGRRPARREDQAPAPTPDLRDRDAEDLEAVALLPLPHRGGGVDRTGDDEAVVWSHVYAFHRMAHTGRPWHLWVQLYDRFERIDGRWYIAEHALNGVDSIPPRPDIPKDWYTGHPDHPPTDHFAPWQERGRASIAMGTPDVVAGMRHLRGAVLADGALPGKAKDRKSTRLNSSH